MPCPHPERRAQEAAFTRDNSPVEILTIRGESSFLSREAILRAQPPSENFTGEIPINGLSANSHEISASRRVGVNGSNRSNTFSISFSAALRRNAADRINVFAAKPVSTDKAQRHHFGELERASQSTTGSGAGASETERGCSLMRAKAISAISKANPTNTAPRKPRSCALIKCSA
jgi:hypothetical protein